MTQLGIVKTLEVFEDLGNFGVLGIGIAKDFEHGVGLSAILAAMTKIAALVKSVKELVVDLPGSLPELMDLDVAEAQQLTKASYELVKKITDSIKK